MSTSKIFFQNSNNLKICGILSEPNPSSRQIVIILHGYSGNMNGPSAVQMSEELNHKKINSLRIDFNGCGESEGDFQCQTITSTVSDTEAAIDYVKKIGYEQIELFGSSMGGLTAMAVCLKHPEISRLGLKCPVSDYISQKTRKIGEDGIKLWKTLGWTTYIDSRGREYKIDYSVFEDQKNYVMFDKVRNICCPVFMVHGGADETVRVEDSKRLVKNFSNCTLVIVPGADHRFTNEVHKQYVNTMFGEWFETGWVMES